MVVFSYGISRARMFLECDYYERMAYLQFSGGGYAKVYNGGAALECLGKRWHCSPDKIIHNLPDKITTAEKELDFSMFYNGLPMAIQMPDHSHKLVWAGWSYKYGKVREGKRLVRKRWVEPSWNDVVTFIEFEADLGYYEKAVSRIMKEGNFGIGLADKWEIIERDGVNYVHIDLFPSEVVNFRVCEGEFLQERFHVRTLLEKEIEKIVPSRSNANCALKIIEEERNKARIV